MKLQPTHFLVMQVLGMGGRWWSEGQIIGLTELGQGALSVCAELFQVHFCERKLVPILNGRASTDLSKTTYRAAAHHRAAFRREWELQHMEASP